MKKMDKPEVKEPLNVEKQPDKKKDIAAHREPEEQMFNSKVKLPTIEKDLNGSPDNQKI